MIVPAQTKWTPRNFVLVTLGISWPFSQIGIDAPLDQKLIITVLVRFKES